MNFSTLPAVPVDLVAHGLVEAVEHAPGGLRVEIASTRDVDSTMSANTTVTVLRAPGAPPEAISSFAPHDEQKRAVSEFGSLQV